MTVARAVIPALVAAALACSSDAIGGPEFSPLPEGAVAVGFSRMDEVHASQYTGISERRRVVIRTQDEWLAFWSEFTGNVQPPPEAPSVDFATQMVIVATMGARNTGGYAISVEGVFEDDGRLIVQVLEQSPGSSCLTTQALTAPATAVIAPITDATVEFDEATMVSDCS